MVSHPHRQVGSLWSHTHIVKWVLYTYTSFCSIYVKAINIYRQFTFYKNICYHYTKEIDLIVPSLFVTTARPQCAFPSYRHVWESLIFHLSRRTTIIQDLLVRRHYIFLLEPWDVRELYIRKTADLLLQLWVSTFPRFVAIGFYFLSETLIIIPPYKYKFKQIFKKIGQENWSS
jgi:hypothetical protein